MMKFEWAWMASWKYRAIRIALPLTIRLAPSDCDRRMVLDITLLIIKFMWSWDRKENR